MQPDLLSPEKEINMPESLSLQELTPCTEEAQLETSPVEKVAEANPSTTMGKKHSKLNPAYIILGVLVFLLFAAFAWVGYWTYSLSTELTNTQQQLAALQTNYAQLQTDHDALKSEKEKLNAELTQTRAELEKTTADLAASQVEISKSRDQNKGLTVQIAQVGKLATVLHTFTTIKDETDFLVLAKQIDDANNEGLSKAWSKVTTFPTEDTFNDFLNYLILAIRDGLR